MSQYNFENISQHKKSFKTEKMKVPVIFHASENLMPEESTLSELENVASQEFVFHHVAAMSDVHSKKGRKNPTGTVVASKNHLMPQINDTAPNCGMRFLKTNLTDTDLEEGKIDNLFRELVNVIPTKAYKGTIIPYSLVMDICRFGAEPIKDFFKTKTQNEIENTYKNGNFFQREISQREILDVIPKLFLQIGRARLGILGAAGNHFLDLMKIRDIKNSELAKKMGVSKGQYIFLMHTGSGLLGQYSSYFYTPKKKEHLSQRIVLEMGKFSFNSQMKKVYRNLSRKINSFKNKDEFFVYDQNTLEGKMFITANFASANHGFANRVILTHNLDNAIKKILGKDAQLDLLYDMPHVFIDKENHFGEDLWIHRNGTVRANGPERMRHHSLFSQTGEPVFIPSSMSTPAYLCTGTNENSSSFFSASHGTGRRKNPENSAAKNKDDLLKKMEQKQVKLFNARSKGVILQDSAYYKDVEEVISGMEENKIVQVVAKMDPIAVLMY